MSLSGGDTKLPQLAKSSSAGAITGAAARPGSSGDGAQGGKLSKSDSLPNLVPLNFKPGKATGLEVDGALVTRTALYAWMKGVRPGWSVVSVAGQKVEDDEAEPLLESAVRGGKRYEVLFKKGTSKFGIDADLAAQAEAAKGKNRVKVQMAFPVLGEIRKVEHRGVTLKQLARVLHFAEEHVEDWTDTTSDKRSKLHGKRLSMDVLNMHHLNAWVLQPGTENRECSFVELLAKQRQPPEWFVTSWWGGRVLDIVESLKAHAEMRKLSVEAHAYWISCFAHRQHENEGRICTDPGQHTITKALKATRCRTLLILDRRATALSRAWCIFELSLIVEQPSLPLDILVYDNEGGTSILTHGMTKDEQALELRRAGAGLQAKAAREAGFPLEVADRGLEIALPRDSEASSEEDKLRLLNVFAGRDVEEKIAVPLCAAYNVLGKRLRGLFGALLLRPASSIATGPSLFVTHAPPEQLCRKIHDALEQDTSRRALDLQLQGLSGEGLRLLARSLPKRLEDLKLRLRCASITAGDLDLLSEGLRELDTLQRVSFDLTGICEEEVTAEHLAALSASLRQQGELAVDLDLAQTEALRFKEEYEKPRKNLAAAFSVSLVQTEEPPKGYRIHKVPLVSEILKLLEKDKGPEKAQARLSALRALVSLGEHAAATACPVLEIMVVDDMDEGVKKAAAKALAALRAHLPKARAAAPPPPQQPDTAMDADVEH
eukprot:TRINITY_DN33657_c0_g1_i1.p1 TRINITY_DN33657_c0_g1~~TRINITY_DN33657_c0_g1_i1.p1  ORF type:complete len:717 (-),score=204.49 TRINITY_DN33657_c0_g1_i1:303-2453(-)